MSPASYLTAPPRVATGKYSASIAAMSSYGLWAAFAFLLVCGVVGSALAVVRGLALWRDVRALKRALGDGLERLADSAEQIERHVTAGAEGSEAVGEALGRLAESQRRLSILVAASRDAQDALGRLTALYPRK